MNEKIDANSSLDFLSVLQQKARAVLDQLIPADAEIILLDYTNTTNVGDSLIWLGEIAYLKSRKLKIRYVSDAENYSLRAIQRVLNKKTIVLMQGGGTFGTVWKKIHDFRLKVLNDLPGIPIIQLPQTIYFNDELKIAEMRNAIVKQGNFTLLTRSQPSYEIAKKNFDTTIYLCPDMAFFIGHIPQSQPAIVQRYILARTDIESSGELMKYPALLNANMTYEVDDWLQPSFIERILYRFEMHTTLLRKWFDPSNLFLMRSWNCLTNQRLKRGIRMLSRGQVVVTDRLHVHILSILLKKPNVLIDNNYGKLRDFYQTWSSDCRYAALVSDAGAIEPAIDTLVMPLSDENAS